MKAISIKEPWASMILRGEKTIETRIWNTYHRGDILLCCSRNPKSEISGKAFAIARIVDCRRMTKEDEEKAKCEVYPNAQSWILEDIRTITPFEVKGKLRIFEVQMQDEEGEE